MDNTCPQKRKKKKSNSHGKGRHFYLIFSIFFHEKNGYGTIGIYIIIL